MEKVITGGQTGIDRLGLEVAKLCGFKTGGTAPKGFKTENGSDYSLRDEFGLVEDSSSDYPPRTIKNIKDSNGTVIFGDTTSRGSKLTIDYCITHSKPYLLNPTSVQLIQFIQDYKIRVLNVAGNRASKISSFKLDLYRGILEKTFKALK